MKVTYAQILVLSSILLVGFTGMVRSESVLFVKNPGELKLMQISQLPEPVEPKVINGTRARPADFPASFYQSSGVGRCTATLIGPSVLLTAAHCVANGGKVTISISATTFKGKCTHHEKWKDGEGDVSADYALCLLDQELAGVTPERLDLAGTGLDVGQKLLLAGFGCTQEDMSGGNDGVFRIGLTKISEMPSYNEHQPNDMLSESDPNENAPAIVCPGDSGGSVYRLKSNSTVSGARSVVAINSRVGLETETKVNGKSYLVATFTSDFKSFVGTWSRRNNVEVCGLTRSMSVACHR